MKHYGTYQEDPRCTIEWRIFWKYTHESLVPIEHREIYLRCKHKLMYERFSRKI